jgi:uncharacterized protein
VQAKENTIAKPSISCADAIVVPDDAEASRSTRKGIRVTGRKSHSAQAFVRLVCLTALTLGAVQPCRAHCAGKDLFAELMTEAPADLAAIKEAGRSLPFGHGRLFRLSREGIPSSFLFGTLHLSDPRVTAFSPRVTEAIAAARSVAVEFVERGKTSRRTAKHERAAAGAMRARMRQRPARLLSADELDLLNKALAQRRIDARVALNLSPFALVLLLDTPACAAARPGGAPHAEALIEHIARRHRVPVVGLETLDSELKAGEDLPQDVARDLLVAGVVSAFRAEAVIETEIRLYIAAEIGELVAWMKSAQPIPGVPRSGFPPAFLARLLDERNLRMRDASLPLLQRGAAFIAVGAAHLPGENGLLRLFELEGYRVERLE